jgi:hypothetical protein
VYVVVHCCAEDSVTICLALFLVTNEWWAITTSGPNIPRKAARSLALLIIWEVWKERNNRIFDHTKSTTTSLVIKIKSEFGLWLSAGAKSLANLSA